jgi:outer membrane protein assembly factor BamA
MAFQPAAYGQSIPQPAIPEASDVSACSPSSPVGNAHEPDEHEISVAELTFEGDIHLPNTDQQQIASELRQIVYRGNSEGVTNELLERIRRAWQDRGYFNVRVRGDSRMLAGSPVSERIAFNAHIIEGPQYRLGEITFEHNKAISNLQALRSLFPIEGHDIFSRQKIAEGLDNLRNAYGQLGYINFVMVPDTKTNEEERLISLRIDMHEGTQFYVSSVNIVGVDEPTRQG